MRPTCGGFACLPLALALIPAQARKVSAPLALGPAGSVGDYRLTPDQARVVYLADERTDGVLELYVTALDESEPPRRLNGGTFPVKSFEIAPDGSRVVFLADDADDATQVTQLYSVLLDDEAPPVRLNGTLVEDGDVVAARISSDSSRVAYSADEDVDDAWARGRRAPTAASRSTAPRTPRAVSWGSDASTSCAWRPPAAPRAERARRWSCAATPARTSRSRATAACSPRRSMSAACF